MNSKIINKKVKHMFPEYRELVSNLKNEDPHFSRLFEEHDELDRKISHMELDPLNHLQHDSIELLKRKKLRLKDELYQILQKNATE